MFTAFIIILFVIVLSTFSKDKRQLQEEPITPIAPNEHNFTIRKRKVTYQCNVLDASSRGR